MTIEVINDVIAVLGIAVCAVYIIMFHEDIGERLELWKQRRKK